MKMFLAALIVLLSLTGGCSSQPPVKPQEIVFTIEGEAGREYELTIWQDKDCSGNWNFCKWQ